MEKERHIKILSIVALVLAIAGMSLGFAAFSTTLNISSSATVAPDSSNFKVGFYASTTSALASEAQDHVYPSTNGSATATSLYISEGTTSISSLKVGFTSPGESVTYSFYVGNSGEYDAYLRAINFNNAIGANSNKVCTAGTDATDSLVQAACNDISISVNVHDITATSTSSSISGKVLYQKTFAPITITIEYAANGNRADGPFSVSFGDVSLDYSSAASSVSLITFTIDGVTYQAEEGMTWLEWVESSYNIDYYYYDGGGICSSNYEKVIYDETTVIEKGKDYSITIQQPCMT
ncbi:MAG: hypothetical protein J6C28_06340 [Bacilli bacterium]|nr:hypothetical protein [Bacilli bacterium]